MCVRLQLGWVYLCECVCVRKKACVCALSSLVDCTAKRCVRGGCVQSADLGPEQCHSQSAACLSPQPYIPPAATDERAPSRAREKSGSQWDIFTERGKHRVAEKKEKKKRKEIREYREPEAENNFYSSITAAAWCKNPFIEYQHTFPSVTDFPLCYLFPQRTPGSLASNRVWCAMGRGWAPTSSWAPRSPTTATAATR